MGTRIKYFDALKFFTIFLVVWGHCIQHFQTNDCSENIIFRYIYSFHMGLFMMISGFFSVSSMRISISSFVTKKFMRLIYPCMVWGGIVWIILEITHSFHYGNNTFSLTGLFSDFYWMTDFWFLKSCFICYCLTYIGIHSRLNKKHWVIISLLISQLIPLFQVPYMFPCFLIGWLLKKNYKGLTDWIFTNPHYFAITFIVMLIFWDHNAWNKSHYFPSMQSIDYTAVIECLCFRIYRLLLGIIGSITAISLFHFVFKANASLPNYINACCKMGVYTLEVYLLHSIIIVRSLKYIINLDNISFIYYSFIITPICSIIILIICIYLAKLTHHSHSISNILWGA